MIITQISHEPHPRLVSLDSRDELAREDSQIDFFRETSVPKNPRKSIFSKSREQ